MYMNYLLWISFLSLFIYGFGDNLRGPLFPEIIQSFSLSDSSASWYFTLASLMSFVSSFTVRKIKKISSLLYLIYLGVFLIFLGFAIQHFANNYTTVLIGSAFFGTSIGFLGMAQNNLVILGTTKKDRARMLSFLHSMYGLASLLAPLFVAWMANFYWQQTVYFFAWVALAFSVIGFALHFRKKDSIEHFAQFQDRPGSNLANWFELKISIVISLYVVVEIMMGTRLALFMRRYSNGDLQSSSLYVTGFFACLLGGRLLFSFSSFSLSTRTILISSLLSSLVCILFGIFVHPIGLMVSGLSLGPFYPQSMAYISHLFPFKSTTIVSWTLAVQSIFIVVMHWGIGKLADLVELKIALVMAPIFLLIGFIILFFIDEDAHA